MTQESPKLNSEHVTMNGPVDSTQPIIEKPQESHRSGGVDFVLITALAEEREAVLSQLPGYKKLPPSSKQIRTYYQAKLPVTFSNGQKGAYHVVVMSLLGMGRVQATKATADAIEHWNPRYVMLVGIAGGIAEQNIRIGDILIADQFVDYESQKVTTKGEEVRYEIYRADAQLLDACNNFTEKEWQQQLEALRPGPEESKHYIGPIASGDKVIAFAELLARYRDAWPRLIGVEMEAGGVAAATFQSTPQPGFLMVRGVSDLADEQKGSSDVKQWRAYACGVAAAFAIALLKSGPVSLKQGKFGNLPALVFKVLIIFAVAVVLVLLPGVFVLTANEAHIREEQSTQRIKSEQVAATAASETQKAHDAEATNTAKNNSGNATATAEANMARTATAAVEGAISFSEQLATSARTLMDSNPHRGLLLSIEAANIVARQNISPIPFVDDTLRFALSHLDGHPLSGHATEVNAVVFSRDSQWVATADDNGLVYLWDQQNFKRISLSGHKGAVTAMAFSPGNNWLATASDDKTARLWRMNSEEGEVHVLDHESGVTSLAFSLYGTQLATGDEQGMIRLWDVVHEEEPPSLLTDHQDRINDIEYSPDGLYLATASQDGTARLWNLADTEEAPRRFDARVGPVTTLAFDPSGRWLITGSADGRAYVWGAGAAGAGPKLLSARHSEAITALEISNDGNWIATGSIDHTVRLQSLTQEIAILTGHEHAIVALSFSADNRWLVTGDSGGQVLLWDLSISTVDKQKPFVLRGHDQSGTFVSFRADSKMLGTAGCDMMINDDCVLGSARLWDIGNSGPIPRDYQDYTSEALVELACNTVGRNLTHAEWEIYFQNQPYRLICAQWAEPAY